MVDVVATGMYWIAVATGLFAGKLGVVPVFVEGFDPGHFHYEHRPAAASNPRLGDDEVAGGGNVAYVRFACGECANAVKGVGGEASILRDDVYENPGLVWWHPQQLPIGEVDPRGRV